MICFIIGSGAGWPRAAYLQPAVDRKLTIAVISQGESNAPHSVSAEGGTAMCSMKKGDNQEAHFTIRSREVTS